MNVILHVCIFQFCELINQKLEGNEIVSLLQWVNAYE